MRQQQIPRLRHIIRDLSAYMPDQTRDDPAVRALLSDGCATIMHVVPLLAPPVEGEDHTKNIDFTPAGMRTRWQAGHTDTSRVLKRACWRDAADAIDAVMVHEGQ